MGEIDLTKVAEKYNAISTIWNTEDKWHSQTKKMIDSFILRIKNKLPKGKIRILNAGSAGYSYGLNEEYILHIDIAKDKLSHLPNSIVGNIENIPLPENQFDLIICVGSVINYCDPILVMKEFDRVLDYDGYIILEFENSFTLELLGKSEFNRRATLVKTFYNGLPEKIWFLSETYIRELARLSKWDILATQRCHVISPLIYRIFRNENFAAKFSWLDGFCSYIPLLRRFSSNTIFLFKRIQQ